jgi:hypothetical protein
MLSTNYNCGLPNFLNSPPRFVLGGKQVVNQFMLSIKSYTFNFDRNIFIYFFKYLQTEFKIWQYLIK